MKVPFPNNSYLKNVEVNDGEVQLNFGEKKKVALLFISLNDRYWPYLSQVIGDCRKNFLPHHNVDYFVWTDYGEESKDKILKALSDLQKGLKEPEKTQEFATAILQTFSQVLRLHNLFQPKEVKQIIDILQQNGLVYKTEGPKAWIESQRQLTDVDFNLFNEMSKQILKNSFKMMDSALAGTTVIETEAVEWPAPTLMRYHLFLDKKEELKDYDYIFYMDADMRVVEKISDEIMGEGLTAAPHPGYYLKPNLIPPYEPNPDSEAYIPRLGEIREENGKKRFYPFYAAGGFQGGNAVEFIDAMERMKHMIDKDFDRNYTPIWNDESIWNKYLFTYQQRKFPITFLDVSYVYPDSLIKEYYEPQVWGKSFTPKIITLTKPFTLSMQAADELREITGK